MTHTLRGRTRRPLPEGYLATKIDASAATGSGMLSILSDHAVTITAGRGVYNEITTNCFGDRIDFLKNHTGRNTFVPLHFNIPAGVNTGGLALTDDSLNAQATQIKNFAPGLDKIDLRKLKMPISSLPYELAITHEDLSGQPTLKDAAERAASHNAHQGKHTITVFQYKCHNEQVRSTYLFNDQSGNQKFEYGDGLIKLVGVSSHGPADFVTLSEFITS
jgi:hypothetical protein